MRWLSLLMLCGCQQVAPPRMSAAERSELKRLVDGFDAEVRRCQAAHQAAFTDLTKVQLTEARCDAPLDAPRVGSNSKESLDAKYFKVWPVVRLKAGEIPDDKDCNPWKWPLERAREALADEKAAPGALPGYARELQEKIGSYQAVVFVRDEQAPVAKESGLLGTASFDPGRVAGRAYLYDFGAGKIVCAGDIQSANSEVVNVHFRAHEMNVLDQDYKMREAMPGALKGDAEAQLRRAIASQLKKCKL